MTGRLLTLLVFFLFICIAGVALIWVAGIYISCLFVSGCYQKLGVLGVLAVVNIKGIVIKGILLALAFTFLTWLKIRQF